MVKKKSSAKKPTKVVPKQSSEKRVQKEWPRRLRLPKKKILRPRFKRIKHPVQLPSAWYITKKSANLLWQKKWIFLSLAVVYGLLSIVFGGLSNNLNVADLKHQLSQAVGGKAGDVTASIAIFSALLSSSGGQASASSGAYQIVLTIIISLAAIWTIRQLSAGNRVRLRDSFYLGMYPLVPFILVLLVIGLQCLPLLLGGTLYSMVVSSGIAVGSAEKLLFLALFVVCAGISLFMLCSSLFALYIVTLPDMTPIKALRSARQLVRYRRGSVFRKLIFLPIILLVVAAVIMVPIIWFIAPVAQIIFFFLSMLSLIIVHTYMYVFYRELLV